VTAGAHTPDPDPTRSVGTQASDPDQPRSVGEIVGDIARDMSTLVRQELQLAKTEVKDEATKAGRGAGMLGGAGVAGHLFLLFLSLFFVFLLGRVMGLEWAALIVALVWAVVAAVLASAGRKELKQVDPSLETTTQTLKEDAQWAKTRKSSN
jgi:uncharacterized membrane protein YqjE